MSLSGSFLLIGLLLASAGGFVIISAGDQDPKVKRLPAYILVALGIALFALGIIR
jgi:hypothetical protein